MSKRRYTKSFEIALSAIACAVATGALALGLLSGWLVGTGYVIAILALMVPLSKQFFIGDFLAYIATVILAVVLGAVVKFWDLVPFAMFFGLHPLLNSLQIRFKVNRWLAFAIKAAWFDCTLIAGYFLIYVISGASLPEQIEAIIAGWRLYVIIFTVGTAIFFVYDYLIFKCQIAVNKLVYRIRK
ncbi:MAG: hypothetical protein K2K60_02440 [Clostridia bacterium]|nr:hypothetical protein [Clostridia bacterium]